MGCRTRRQDEVPCGVPRYFKAREGPEWARPYQLRMNARRSALITSAFVVIMPCGKPG